MQLHRAWAVLAAVAASSVIQAAGNAAGAADLPALLARVGARIERYYAQARTVICTETMELQPLDFEWAPRGLPRRIVDELTVEWDPANPDGAARVRRRIVTVNGRPPKPKDADKGDACMDPKPVSPEPLEFLLPSRRADYVFTWAGVDRLDGHEAAKIDYRPAHADPPSIVWTGDCVSVDVPAQERGRVWVDLDSGDVLRLDERLAGRFDFNVPPSRQHAGAPSWMEIERADSSIRYKPVAFHNPDEMLMLPASIDSLQVIRNAGAPRVRTHQAFTNYRRFLTSGKLVPPIP